MNVTCFRYTIVKKLRRKYVTNQLSNHMKTKLRHIKGILVKNQPGPNGDLTKRKLTDAGKVSISVSSSLIKQLKLKTVLYSKPKLHIKDNI